MIPHSKIVRCISFSTDRACTLDISGMEEFTKDVRRMGGGGIVLFDHEMHDHETVFWNLYRVSDVVDAMQVSADDKLAYVMENGSGESENAIASTIRAGGIVEIGGNAYWALGVLPNKKEFQSRSIKNGTLTVVYSNAELKYKVKGAQ